MRTSVDYELYVITISSMCEITRKFKLIICVRYLELVIEEFFAIALGTEGKNERNSGSSDLDSV
jgi:hypothetical protein